MITPVILSGGSGTRLWPLSTAERPKQFHALTGTNSMFAQTLARAADRARFASPIVVCGSGHVAHVRADLATAGVDDATIIVEPAARNTAPAIALAAHAAGSDATLLVMPSDHVISDLPAFLAAIDKALPEVAQGALATFGIAPASPHTGYGYIACGEQRAEGVHSVDRFVEKPDAARATAMLAQGGHVWNAGIFLMRADAYLAALASNAPAIAGACAAAMASPRRERDIWYPDTAAFIASPSESIDYTVMEKAANVVTVPVDPGWSDVGSWSALHELAEKDAAGNASLGEALVIDCSGTLLNAAPGMRIAALGIHDLIVIATGSDILVIPRDRAQDIKALVDALPKPSPRT
jgi:mannose-1-phosphate guanylyltransferase/mannose-6-phosphate isomerase